VTDFLLFVGALLLASLLRGKSKPSFIWVIAAILVAVAGQAFARLPWGGGFVSGLLGSFLGLFGSAASAATFLLIFLTGIVIFDVIVDKKLDSKGAAALFVIPLLLLLTGGPLASGLDSAYGSLSGAVVNAVSSI
jgi:hypothetical protein